MIIGLLHPGEMGASLGDALVDSGHSVLWCVEGRSDATRQRAARFKPVDHLTGLTGAAEAIVSVCPPHAALHLAQSVAETGFKGIYVDANAVSPATAGAVAECVGAGYVDGGIIGPPAREAGQTRCYLSGPCAREVADWFSAGALEAVVLEGETLSASALKMAYAAYTKGSSALLLAVNALAEHHGVRDALNAEWDLSQPGLARRSSRTAAGTSRKAWRFEGEMLEIARTLEEAGLDGHFHRGAAATYRSMAELKDAPPASLETVLNVLLGRTGGPAGD